MNKRGMRRIIRTLSVTTALFMTVLTLDPVAARAQMDAGSASNVAGSAVLAEETFREPGAGEALPSPGNVTVNFRDVDIKTVLHYLSDVSGVDIIPAPGVDAKVTMRLRDRPWETALDIVTRNHGYVYSREQGIIRVMPRGQLAAEETVTQVISLNNITREIELMKAKEGLSEQVTVEQREESIQQLMTAINSMLNPARGERATYIGSVNSVVVTAIPSKLSEIRDMIRTIDKKPPQIVLDAKVVEITLSKDERFGVDWNAVVRAAGARRPITFPFDNTGIIPWLPGAQRDYYARAGSTGGDIADPNIPTTVPTIDVGTLASPLAAAADGALFSFGTLDFSTFTATLSLLDQRGDTEILSSPRITTLDNRKATIKVIKKLMLQKSVETTQTATLVTVEYESEAEAREVGVKLTVIPHVNEDGDISVNLLPEVSSDIVFDVVDVGAGDNTVALTYNSREANTIVRVRDGETIFLGGLIQKDSVITDNKLPILGDLFGGVPVLGNIFKYEAQNERRTEIAFFVTVHLVKDALDSVTATQSQDAYQRYIANVDIDKFGSADKTEEGKAPVIKKGIWKTSEETEKIEVHVSPEAEKSKKRPFFDFRKK